MAATWLLITLAVAAVFAAPADAATRHIVGGSAGWGIPSSASLYSQWASGQKFAVGDTLVFNFATGAHDVIKVPKAGYDGCTAKNQIGANITTGPATVTLTSSGSHYFICGVPGHCSIGQKLAVSVAAGAAPSGPAPAPAPGGPAPAVPGGSSGSSSPSPMAGNPGASAGGPSSTPSGGNGPSTSSAPWTLYSSGYIGALAVAAFFLL